VGDDEQAPPAAGSRSVEEMKMATGTVEFFCQAGLSVSRFGTHGQEENFSGPMVSRRPAIKHPRGGGDFSVRNMNAHEPFCDGR